MSIDFPKEASIRLVLQCRHGRRRADCEDPECVVAEVLEEPETPPVGFVHRTAVRKNGGCPACDAGVPRR